MLKIWDYQAQKAAPYFFKSYIGHTHPVKAAIFNPLNNKQIFSIGSQDGIYIWDFNGDTQTNFHPQPEETSRYVVNKNTLHQTTMLEQMRELVKAKQKPKLPENSFVISEFFPAEQFNKGLHTLGQSV